MDNLYFYEIDDPDIPFQYADFMIGKISYTISFAKVIEGSLDFDEFLSAMTKNRTTYSIEFSLSDIFYDKAYQGDLYAVAEGNAFNRSQYLQLREQLILHIVEHYKCYHAECYFFVADRRSLLKMYEKMCNLADKRLFNFKPVMGLGAKGESFLILTPIYQENNNEFITQK